jgi:hypothetical protein
LTKIFYTTALFLLLFFSSGCKDKSRFSIDTKHIPVTITIERFDKDVYNLQVGDFDTQLDDILHKYGSFLDIYTQNVLEIGTISPQVVPSEVSSTTKKELLKMLQDTMVQRIYQDCFTEYKKRDDVEKTLNTAFRYFQHYFPEKQTPRVLFHFSGFHQTVVFTDSIVSASIEHYLGADYPLYQQVAYQYEIPTMTRKQLPLDIVHAWIKSYYDMNPTNERLLDHMIYEGKIRYLLSVFFPDYPANEIMGYSKEQYEWSLQNEKNIWGHIIENKRLFSNNWREIAGFINPGPFTSGFSDQSPSRLGVWIGFRIVQQYAENNKEVTLKQLMEDPNSQGIVERSGYRP